jgi:integrase/recombinase XerD
MLLSHTGLRATETCALKWEDINFEKGVLLVALGKGGKRRAIGIGAALQESFNLYLEAIPKPRKDDFIFVNRLGGQMNRSGLYQRLERLGLKANVKVSPHALRRAFVTINANKGRPLQMLQMACGHSDIKTTMSYSRTSGLFG